MFCRKCGKEIPNDSNVCQYCGSQVTPRKTANTYTNFNNSTMNNSYQAQPVPQKKKTPWKIIAPIVAVLLIVAIVFGVFACTNSKKKAVEDKLRQILEESTTKPVVEFMCEDYDGDGTYEAYAVVGNSEEKEEYVEYYDADICFVNETEAEVIKDSVRGHANGTIEVGNTIYVSLEVYDDGAETGKSFIYTADNNESVESDISGQYANVHEEDGKVIGKDENGNEIEVELTDRNQEETDDNVDVNEEKLTRTNYYDSDGKLLYYECYTYYANGLLCSSTLTSVEYYDDEMHSSGRYTFLYLYDENGNQTDKVLESLSSFDTNGEVTLDYSNEIKIYPERESIAQEKFGVDPSKTEEVYGETFVYSVDSTEDWADVYLQQAFVIDEPEQIVKDETQCTLFYVDDNSIPELRMDYSFGYVGSRIYTQSEGKTDEVLFSHGNAEWQEKENALLLSGGWQGMYYDDVYKIQDGKFVKLGSGENLDNPGGANTGVSFKWNGVKVTEKEYNESLDNVFNGDDFINAQMNVYTYDQCKLLLETISKMN